MEFATLWRCSMCKKSGKKKEEYKFKPLPEFMQKLLESGGLIPYIKKQKW